MIKLTKEQPHGADAIVRVEGRLDSEAVRELDAFVEGEDSPGGITLDLSGLASVDQGGRAALLRLRASGHRIVGASLYIHRLLEESQT